MGIPSKKTAFFSLTFSFLCDMIGEQSGTRCFSVKNRRGVAQFGSALEWGSRGRKFDSCHSDHKVSVRKNAHFFYCKILTAAFL